METIDKIISIKQYFLMNLDQITSSDMIMHLSQLNGVDVFYVTNEFEIIEYNLHNENNKEYYQNTLESNFLELNDFSYDITTPVIKEYEVGQRALLYDNKDWSLLTSVCSIPIVKSESDFGYLILVKFNDKFEKDFSYFAITINVMFSIIVLEKARARQKIKDESAKKIQIAIDALSYSEVQAAKRILNNIENGEGYVVASKIADEFEITRSIIVNALRKLESAGLLKSKSLGMKGTHIKIINKDLKKILNIRD
jgi:transcriptional pleiotropic repressor